MLFESWSSFVRVVLMAFGSYLGLIILLRVSGKRTLTKMNAFDLVITVAFGSMLATIILSRDVTYVEGVTGLACLVYMQFAVTWLSVRFPAFQQLVKARPQLLYYQQSFLTDILRKERITEEEVAATVRAQGFARWEDVQAVILETDGSLSVLKDLPDPHKGTLEHVRR